MTEQKPSDVYLGDGVYASNDGFQVWLAANHHDNKLVAIELPVMQNLIRYATEFWGADVLGGKA